MGFNSLFVAAIWRGAVVKSKPPEWMEELLARHARGEYTAEERATLDAYAALLKKNPIALALAAARAKREERATEESKKKRAKLQAERKLWGKPPKKLKKC